eukprot:Gregarina_sp_Pseudo_9__1585@NODE_2066_length_1172_cov_45_451898_g1908_i0_p1_GENE_NODE_2066_length_1172_cov_45_451898_g1908_i0NODE_2066_length_1172_cov_45_451898_g1908_i0_p1_ORF_typecomplete_len237_score22_38_NODE_2066_length_1172_cov_45_451898_g1908_i03231033
MLVWPLISILTAASCWASVRAAETYGFKIKIESVATRGGCPDACPRARGTIWDLSAFQPCHTALKTFGGYCLLEGVVFTPKASDLAKDLCVVELANDTYWIFSNYLSQIPDWFDPPSSDWAGSIRLRFEDPTREECSFAISTTSDRYTACRSSDVRGTPVSLEHGHTDQKTVFLKVKDVKSALAVIVHAPQPAICHNQVSNITYERGFLHWRWLVSGTLQSLGTPTILYCLLWLFK